MNTSGRYHLTATLALAAAIGATTLVAAPAPPLNVQGSSSHNVSQPSVCAAESTLIHGPVDVGRSRPHGIPVPK